MKLRHLFVFHATVSLVFGIACILTPTPLAQPSTSPPIVKTCTVEGCGVTLTVTLSGAVPDDYVLGAVTPDGEKMSVHCVNGSGQYADDHFDRISYPVCEQGRVTFVRFSPDEVTITVSWDGEKVSQSFKPVYESEYPNGPECLPECRIGQVTLIIPDK